MRKAKLLLVSPLIIALLWTMSSCVFDDYPEDQSGIIIVSLDGISTRALNEVTISEEKIEKIRIFVFVGPALEKNEVFAQGDDDFINPFRLDVAVGSKEVYVVANENTALTPLLEGVNSKTDLLAILANEIDTQLSTPLLMTGIATNVQIISMPDNQPNTLTIKLNRVAAKIDLRFKKDTDAEVKITKVSLLNNTKKSTLWEGSTTIENQSYWDHSEEFPLFLTLTTASTALDPIYVYENIGDGSKENAVQLEVEALYNQIPTKYRVYINENVSTLDNPGDPSSSVTDPSDHLYSIKRNHSYIVSGTIINIGEFDGLRVSSLVLPWSKLTSDLLIERTYTITPTPTDINYSYNTNSEGKVSFTFKLTNPIDASWTANLSNPTDFEFVGVYQGNTDDEVTLVIKARNIVAGTEPRTTELYINVQYGGNWSEIPLLSGSILVGAGNRVVIQQAAKP